MFNVKCCTCIQGQKNRNKIFFYYVSHCGMHREKTLFKMANFMFSQSAFSLVQSIMTKSTHLKFSSGGYSPGSISI